MLACDVDLSKLRFPVFCQPKIDGVRAYNNQGVLYTRNGKLFPNKRIREEFSKIIYDGYDGEIYDGESFITTSAKCRTLNGEAEGCVWNLFDRSSIALSTVNHSYRARFQEPHPVSNYVQIVQSTLISNLIELKEYFTYHSTEEGIILRSTSACYKEGRSTMVDQSLMRWKKFDRETATVTEVLPRMNKYKQELPEVGAFVCGEFKVSPGVLSREERKRLWELRNYVVGHVLIYKFADFGSKNKPRFPTFQGFEKVVTIRG